MFGRKVKATAMTAGAWYGAITASALAQVPNPGRGKQPPGFDKFALLMSWVAYIGFAVCVLGLIVCGATMAIEHRNGGSGGMGGRVGQVMIGCIIIGTASGIVTALT